jgi:hypothetical protein
MTPRAVHAWHERRVRRSILTVITAGGAMNKLLIVALACLAGGAHAAGTVQVRFVAPENFADVRDRHQAIEPNLRALEQVVVRAAAPHVPDGRTLTVDITDVDLAGYVHPGATHGAVRVLRGSADWPRIDLRWSLDGPSPRSGQAVLRDMAYQQRIAPPINDTALVYEQRMLRDYFRSQFGAASAH